MSKKNPKAKRAASPQPEVPRSRAAQSAKGGRQRLPAPALLFNFGDGDFFPLSIDRKLVVGTNQPVTVILSNGATIQICPGKRISQ